MSNWQLELWDDNKISFLKRNAVNRVSHSWGKLKVINDSKRKDQTYKSRVETLDAA